MGKNIGKNISKNLSGKYSQKRLDHAKRSAADALKITSKRVIQKTAEETGDLIGRKMIIELRMFQEFQLRIIKKQLRMNMINKYLKKKNIFPQERQKIIDDLRLI